MHQHGGVLALGLVPDGWVGWLHPARGVAPGLHLHRVRRKRCGQHQAGQYLGAVGQLGIAAHGLGFFTRVVEPPAGVVAAAVVVFVADVPIALSHAMGTH